MLLAAAAAAFVFLDSSWFSLSSDNVLVAPIG